MNGISILDGYKLFHEASEALADVEFNGINIDVEYIKRQQKHLTRRIKKLVKKLYRSEELKLWKKIYKKKFNMNSDTQLADILFKQMGHTPTIMTKGEKPSVSEEALELMDIPITKDLLLLRKLKKTKNTYLKNYLKEEVEGILHPFFHLHTTKTFRSSSSSINFQNQPVRVPELKRIIRQAVIPRPGNMICEIDYSGIEVSIVACYHKDPNMLKDILDPNRDMHRDMAMECYKLDLSQITKDIRYCGKNMFVFPQFYGDYYANNANDLWNAVTKLKLKTQQREPLKTHLKRVGLSNYKRFENHIRRVEKDFWGRRYLIYAKWKEKQWKFYQKNGFVEALSGFRYTGLMSRNEAINYPIQGPAFHCLLWSLIHVNKWLKENKMGTKIIGQIHDSMVLDIPPKELDIVLENVRRIMTEEIRKFWSWIILPLEVEIELTPVNGSWYLKKEVIESEECDCGNRWLYQHLKSLTLECPVCGKIRFMEDY